MNKPSSPVGSSLLRSGWTAVAVLCLAVLAIWLPDINLPLGNSDDGRILGRVGLQARNFWELGPTESRFGANVEPFIRAEYDVAPRSEPPREAITYAHHPPLIIFSAIATVGAFGDNLPALRIAQFLMGAATVAFMASLLRVRGMGWTPTLLALVAMVSTGFFYVYARIGVGYSLLVAITAAVAWLRQSDNPPRWAVWGVGALAALSAMQSWIALATLGLLVPWLFSARHSTSYGSDSGTDDSARARLHAWLRSHWSPGLTALVVGGFIGSLITAAWLLNATNTAELAERVSFRVGNDVNTASEQTAFSFGEFLSRQWSFASHELLAPLWLRVLLLPALVAGFIDRRTRAPMLITLAFAATLTFGFQQGAWVHRLWNFPWLAPVTVGLAALFDAIRRMLATVSPRLQRPAVAAGVALAAATLSLIVTGGTRDYYLTNPAYAGEVLEQSAPHVNAEVAWITSGISTARWVSYYLDAPVFRLDKHEPTDVFPSDVILVRTGNIPDYLMDPEHYRPIASSGDYALLSPIAPR